MSNYFLLLNQTATQSAPPPVFPVDPWGNVISTAPPAGQTFELVVTATAGNASGTAQVVVSNDGLTWINYGDPMIAPSAYLTAKAAMAATQQWNMYGAYLTAISGTGAEATLTMQS